MKKKIWMTLGASPVIMAPLVSLVACENKQSSETPELSQKPEWSHKITSDAVEFNVAKSNPEALVEMILSTLGTKMPKPINELTPYNEQRYNALYDTYLSKANFSRNIIRLVNGSEKYDLDFTDVLNNIRELKRIAETFKFDDLAKNKDLLIGLRSQGVHGTEYTKIMLNSKAAMSLSWFMKMVDPTKKYERLANDEEVADDPDVKGQMVFDVDIQVAQHPYINLLKAYHKTLYKFTQSDFYKEWVKGKTFTVAVNTTAPLLVGTFDGDGTMTIANVGELYDKPDAIKKLPETSNFEFSFFYSLVGLK